MHRAWFPPRHRQAFTLIELLVVIAIIGILAALALPIYKSIIEKSRQLTTLSNMRQIGGAFMLYAGENNNQLPRRESGPSAGDKWPKLLATYVQNLKIYSAPIPTYTGTKYQVTDPTLLVDNNTNYTDYIANGYNDITPIDTPMAPRLSLITNPSQVILLGIPIPGKNNFYMDFSENGGNNNDVLDKKPWPDGSIYVFSDGSSRFLKYRATDSMTTAPTVSGNYSDWLWLINKSNSSVIQSPPATH